MPDRGHVVVGVEELVALAVPQAGAAATHELDRVLVEQPVRAAEHRRPALHQHPGFQVEVFGVRGIEVGGRADHHMLSRRSASGPLSTSCGPACAPSRMRWAVRARTHGSSASRSPAVSGTTDSNPAVNASRSPPVPLVREGDGEVGHPRGVQHVAEVQDADDLAVAHQDVRPDGSRRG